MKTKNSHYPTYCKYEDKLQESMRIRIKPHIWYVDYAWVEPSADSFSLQPNTVVVRVKHRNVQLAQS